MFCKNCGKEYVEEFKFCPYCGNCLSQMTADKKRKPLYKRWWFWVLLGILSLITLIIFSSIVDYANRSRYYECKIGEQTELNSVFYTVTNVKNAKKIGSDYYFTETDYNYVIITINAYNDYNTKVNISSLSYKYYVGDKEYDVSSASYYIDNNRSYITLAPGMETTFEVVFEIPSNYSSSDYLLIYNYDYLKVYMQK